MFVRFDTGESLAQRELATTREAPASEVEPGTDSVRTRRMPVQSAKGSGSAGPLAAAAGGLAQVVRLVAWVVVAIIVAGILLVVLKANPTNTIVSAVHDTAHALIGPFAGMFKLHDARMGVVVNWGIAAVVYLLLGYLVARLITMIGNVRLRRRRAVTP